MTSRQRFDFWLLNTGAALAAAGIALAAIAVIREMSTRTEGA